GGAIAPSLRPAAGEPRRLPAPARRQGVAMSNVLAIAATTRTLRNLLLARIPALDAELSDLEVTLQPPDIARKGISKSQLNLFLFQVVTNAAWSNLDMPGRVRPGETAPPALALNLHYLITAWGRGDSDSDALSHRVLAANEHLARSRRARRQRHP